MSIQLKNILLLIFLFISFLVFSCEKKSNTVANPTDNTELTALAKLDQEMRAGDQSKMDAGKDRDNRFRTLELLAMGKINTPKDKLHAALILQHTNLTYCGEQLVSESVENYLLASYLSEQAYLEGFEEAKWMFAANLDRYLWLSHGIQKYGTQKMYVEEIDDFQWVPIDSLTTDEERKKFGIPSLKELLKQTSMAPYPTTSSQ